MTLTIGDITGHLGNRLQVLWASPTCRMRRVTCVTRAESVSSVTSGLLGELMVIESEEDCSDWLLGLTTKVQHRSMSAVLCTATAVPVASHERIRDRATEGDTAVGVLARGIVPGQVANDLSRLLASVREPGPSELTRAETLQGLAESLGRLIGNSVTIETPHHELLANSPTGDDVDQDRVETILHRRADARIMQHRDFKSFFTRVRSSDWPIHLEALPEYDFSGRIAMRIAHESELLGVIWATDTARPLSEQDYAAIQQAAGVAGSIMARDRLGARREALLRAELLDEVVVGRIADPENVRSLGLTVGWNVDRIQHVIVAAIDDFEAFRVRYSQLGSSHLYREQDRLLDLVKLEVQAFDHSAVIGMRSSSIVVLVSLHASEPVDRKRQAMSLAESIQRKAQAFLSNVTLTLGVGTESPCLEHLSDSFRQAEVAVHLGQTLWGGNRVVHYDDLGIHRVLFAVRDDEGMVTPALQRLVDHDREHNTEYVLTLRTYLNHMGRLRTAADELNIHRNTLEYRVGRIAEVAGIPLEDPDNRLALELGLRVLELKKG